MSGLEVEHGSEDTGHDLVNGETSPTPPSSSGSPSHKLDNINLMLADSFGDKTKLDDAAAAIIPNGNAEVASSRQQDQQQQAAKQSAASTDDVSLAPADRLWTTERDGAVLLRINASGPLSDTPETINQLFERTVKLYGDHKALASKEGNTWKILTYKEYYAQCRQAAKSFLKLGLQRYHGVGILGFNSAEWFISDIGAILAGGFAVGIYTTNSAEACQYVADNCLANIIVVENDKQLQKILEVQSQLPHLKAIVQYKGELKEKKPNVYSWAEFMRAGEEVPDAQLDAIIASQRANQCCSLIYTSGTTGSPKGVMLSHDNLTWTATVTGELTQLRSADDNYQEVVISYLPLSHIAAQLVDIWLPMRFGGVTYFAQPDALKGSLVVTMKEVRPTGFMGVPRVWEKMMEKMKATAAKSGIFKRKIAGWAKSVGLQTHLANMKGNPAEAPMGYTLANMLVFKKVREALGLDRCTKCYTGAAPITRDTLEFFLSLDIPVFELYGMSESSGPHTISSPTAFQIGSCGTLLRGCRTLLHSKDEEGSGEVCFWGRHVFMGYLNMEEKTREAIDDDGWLHSGDLGRVDEQGLLYITGRIKELIITAGGENVPPIPIEDAIKEELPVVSNAMVIGDRRKFLSVLLTLKCESNGDSGEPDDALTDEVVHWCQRVGSTATRASQIAGGKDPVVERAIRDGIERVNKRAPSNAQRVQKWELLLRDFSIPGGELGPTMKLKRPVVTKIYQELIERLYEDAVSPTTPDAPLPTQ